MTRINDSNAIDNVNATTIDDVIELLAEHCFGGMAKAIETLTNEVMKLERNEVLGAALHERSWLIEKRRWPFGKTKQASAPSSTARLMDWGWRPR